MLLIISNVNFHFNHLVHIKSSNAMSVFFMYKIFWTTCLNGPDLKPSVLMGFQGIWYQLLNETNEWLSE